MILERQYGGVGKSQTPWIWFLAQSFPSCVTLGDLGQQGWDQSQ